MKFVYCMVLVFFILSFGILEGQSDVISVSEDIELIKLSENAYVHVSYFDSPDYGSFPSNGLIYIDKGEAFLFDTPMTEKMTETLISWIRDTMHLKIVGFVPNHWHDDCIGGLEYLNRIGIKTYGNILTCEITKSKHLPVPKYCFKDSTVLMLGDKKIICKYFGAAHTADNIVVWIPSEKILFPGCMVKEMKSNSLGNTADSDFESYPATLKKVLENFPDTKIVIPGHGKIGGLELIKHTIELTEKIKK